MESDEISPEDAAHNARVTEFFRSVVQATVARIFQVCPKGGPRPRYSTVFMAAMEAYVTACGGWDNVFAHNCDTAHHDEADYCKVCGGLTYAEHMGALFTQDCSLLMAIKVRNEVPEQLAQLVAEALPE